MKQSNSGPSLDAAPSPGGPSRLQWNWGFTPRLFREGAPLTETSAIHGTERRRPNFRIADGGRGPGACVIHVEKIEDQAETMRVPYAKKWQKETDKLRKIALDCCLTEELKWGKPCFTFSRKNVAIVIPLKDSCAFSFFKGALLKDPKRILERIGENTQAGRWIKFTSVEGITALRSTLSDYLYEAIELEESGKKVPLKKPAEYAIPDELQTRLDNDAVLKAAFEALTPGRRKSYFFHISSAKQAKTRVARAEKCVPTILSGRGYNERAN